MSLALGCIHESIALSAWIVTRNCEANNPFLALTVLLTAAGKEIKIALFIYSFAFCTLEAGSQPRLKNITWKCTEKN